MCGFAALFEPGRRFAPELLDRLDRDLLHRGPDSAGRWVGDGAALVFRRLAIMDVEERSDQPFRTGDGRYVVVFNGEIYNFRDLRRQLSDQGVAMRTNSDTEVVAEGFARWGERVFDKLEGMFAVIVYDLENGNVTAARDPLGIKPLYIARRGRLFAAASEMRPLRRVIERTEVDPEAFAELLYFHYAAGRLSNLKGIELLPGGTVARYSISDGGYSERRFADPLELIGSYRQMSEAEAVEIAEAAVEKSIIDHMQSDVGYSLQLSGGVDSSLVLAIAAARAGAPVDSYSIRLEDPQYDESRYRERVVAQYQPRHHEQLFTGEDFAEGLPRALYYMEGPSPHMGCVLLMLLCGVIRERHKVVLTGEGADEFFGGYSRYGIWRTLARQERIAKMVPRAGWPLLQRYIYLKRFQDFDAAAIAGQALNLEAVGALFPDLALCGGERDAASARARDFRERLFAVDHSAYLESLLMRQDKLAMSMSVEARVPFAHMPLVRSVASIPLGLKVPGGVTKPILKAVARKRLPVSVVDRKKVGLNLPFAAWLQDPLLGGRHLDLLTEPNARLASFCDRKALRATVEAFRADATPTRMSLTPHLVNLELWLRSLEWDEAPGSRLAPTSAECGRAA